MKIVTGRVISAEPISLSKAATLLSGYASSDNGATKAFRVYLRRASDAFTELKSFHREIKSSSGKDTPASGEIVRTKGVDDLVGNGGKIRFGKSENLIEEVSVHGQKQYEIKEEKRKKKSKNKKEEYVVDEKVKEKLEYEQRNEDRKKKKWDVEIGSEERKSKKRKKSQEIDG